MPVEPWDSEAERTFAELLRNKVKSGALVYRGFFGMEGAPSALIIDRPMKKACGYTYDGLRIFHYYDHGGGEFWQDILQAYDVSGGHFAPGDPRRGYEYCVNFSILSLPNGEKSFLINRYINGVKAGPLVYEQEQSYSELSDSERLDPPIGSGTAMEWLAYHFPDNSAGWPEEARRTMTLSRGEYVQGRGDVLRTGNPTVLTFTHKNRPAVFNSGPGDKVRYISGRRDWFREIRIREYRDEWGGWKERLLLGEKIYVDGVLAGPISIDPGNVDFITILSYDEEGKLVICSEINWDGMDPEEVVRHCARYGGDDKFDVGGFAVRGNGPARP